MQIIEETKTITVRYIECDGMRFYCDQRGYWLGQVNGKCKRLHVYVWEKHNGPIPKGYHIHHIDHNTNNNEIDNLQLMTMSEHLSLHGQDESHKAKARRNLAKYAQPKAAEWHKSKECREWAKENYKVSLAKVHEEKVNKVCEVCGNKYITDGSSKTISRFCSNACKSKWRRDNNLDDIQKTCPVCGKNFYTHKYKGSKTCSRKCGTKLMVYRRNGIHWDS